MTASEDTAQTILSIVPTICSFGIGGIILTVIVLSRKHMSTSTNIYLMALAISDLLYLLKYASKRIGERIIEDFYKNVTTENAEQNFIIYDRYISHTMQIFLLSSIWLTVVLAIERWVAICQPFLASKFCTVFRSRLLTVLIFLFATLCRLTSFFDYKVVKHVDRFTDKVVVYGENTKFAETYFYLKIYPWIIDVFISSLIPFFLLLALNVKLILEVRKSTRYLQKNLGTTNHRVQKEELQITVMLISVIVVFFVCQVGKDVLLQIL